MAQGDQVRMLLRSVTAWNKRRPAEPDLRHGKLRGAQLSRADLRRADLTGANLREANLRGANLYEAILTEATLRGADLSGANLVGADLTGATVHGTNFAGAHVDPFTFLDVDLDSADGLDSIVVHGGPTQSGNSKEDAATVLGEAVTPARSFENPRASNQEPRPAAAGGAPAKHAQRPSQKPTRARSSGPDKTGRLATDSDQEVHSDVSPAGPTPTIPGYSAFRKIAAGGFSTVYRARQDRHDRLLAVKVITVDVLNDSTHIRFERECRAMGRLSWHPNVVALVDSGVTVEGNPYLAMEYLTNGSLGDRVAAGGTTWHDALKVGVQVAGALDVAHAEGILHRDLKPGNILLDPFNDAKLGDFGLALIDELMRATTGHASFTADHVAPEVIEGKEPDARSDIYGLASTMYTLIEGTAPYRGTSGEPIATQLMRLLSAPVPRPASAPADLAELIASALSKQPTERPSTAIEFGQMLQRCQLNHGLPVTDLKARVRADVPKQPRASESADESSPRPPASDSAPTVSLPRAALRAADPQPTIDYTSDGDVDDAGSTVRLDRSGLSDGHA